MCHLYAEVTVPETDCSYDCTSGPRSCFSPDSASASAVIGGVTSREQNVADVEVFEESGLCLPGLVPDLPEAYSRRYGIQYK